MCMIAGTSTIRIKVGQQTAAARPKPMSWTASTRVKAKRAEHQNHDQAALVMVRPCRQTLMMA